MKTTWTPVACLALILAACILTSGLQADPSIRFVQRVRAAKSELEPYLDPNGPYKDDINLPDGGGTLEALLSNCNYTGASHISRYILGTVQYYNGTIREQFFLNSIEGECTYEDSDGKSGVVSVRSDSVQFQILIHPGVKNVTLLPEIRHGTLAFVRLNSGCVVKIFTKKWSQEILITIKRVHINRRTLVTIICDQSESKDKV